MKPSSSPLLYCDELPLIEDLKSWGFKPKSTKANYKSNDVLIVSSTTPALLDITFFSIHKSEKIQISRDQLRPFVFHLNYSHKKQNSFPKFEEISKKKYLQKALVKVGGVDFPLGFWLDFSNSKTVKDLLEKLFDLPVFLKNAYLLLCVLKKGESFATVYDYSRGRKLKKINLESEKFNAVYDHVKKNKKGYLFNMSNLSYFLNVQGYAQGGAASSSSYQVVFLVSKNELIPPTQEEINAIKLLLPELIPWIEYILNTETKENKIELYSLITKYLPVDLDINLEQSGIKQQWKGRLQEFVKDLDKIRNSKIQNIEVIAHSNSDEAYLDLNHYQRVKLLGELFNTLKHELSNPLFGLKLSQQVVVNDIKDPQLAQLWNNVEINVTRCEQILESALDLFKERNINQLFDLDEVIRQALLLSKSKIKGIIIEQNIQSAPKIKGDPSLLLHIIFNLLINAGEHLQNLKNQKSSFVGKILIEGQITHDDNLYKITVADNGEGIPSEIQSKLFQKFVTTKSQGTGLGLSLSHKLAQKLPGELSFAGNGIKLSGAHFHLDIKR